MDHGSGFNANNNDSLPMRADYNPLALSLAPPYNPPPPVPAPRRRNSGNVPIEVIEPPFPWATNEPCTVYPVDTLISRGITTVKGNMQCRQCEAGVVINYNLRTKFNEVANFLLQNIDTMHNCAPAKWKHPALTACTECKHANSMRPVVPEEKEKINWLFLLLGQTLGCCSLHQLKYFCSNAGKHRTGAKDRVLYTTYITLCRQLDPNGPFKNIP